MLQDSYSPDISLPLTWQWGSPILAGDPSLKTLFALWRSVCWRDGVQVLYTIFLTNGQNPRVLVLVRLATCLLPWVASREFGKTESWWLRQTQYCGMWASTHHFGPYFHSRRVVRLARSDQSAVPHPN